MSLPSGAPSPVQKTMSSRLLTMKFMQRAAASPKTPPQTPDTQPAKRQKTDTHASAPAPLSDLQAVRDALKVEEDRKIEALDRLAANAGETKWVLSCVKGGEADKKGSRNLQVLTTGYSEIDQGSIGASQGHEGRRSFGMFNHKLEKYRTGTAGRNSLSSDEAPEAEDKADHLDSDDPAGANELIRESRNVAIEQAKMNREADKPMKEADAEAGGYSQMGNSRAIELNKLSSISGGGGGKSGRLDPTQRRIVRKNSTGKRKYEFE